MFNEREVILKITQGDENAFRELYNHFSERVYNTALSVLQQETEAEDITQEVFILIFKSINSFKFESSLQTWIYKITVNRCYDQLKKHKTAKRFAFFTSLFNQNNELAHDKSHFEHPGVLLEQKEHAKVLFMALDKIPSQQKIAFTLVKIEGLSYKQAAEVMNTSSGALESLLSRANKNLRTYISEYYKNNLDITEGNSPFYLLM